MNFPLLTIAICTYNGEKFLARTLESVINQDYPNFEVVMVDDGSNDATISIIHRYSSKYSFIRPFFRSNSGLAASRNFAFSQSKGEWIAIIDQDDLCYPTRLKEQFEVANQYPTAGLIFCDTRYIDENDQVIDNHFSKFTLPDAFIGKMAAGNLLLRQGCFVDSEACFIHRETVNLTGDLDTTLHHACDYEYFIRAGMIVDFAYTKQPLAAWRVHPSQATKTYPKVRHEVRKVFWRCFWARHVTILTRLILLKKIARSLVGGILDQARRDA